MSTPENENTPQQPPVPGAVPPAAPVPPAAQTPPPAAPPVPPAGYPANNVTAAPPTRVPTTITLAFWLYVASAVLSVAAGIVTIFATLTMRESARDALLNSDADLDGRTSQQVADVVIGVAVTWAIVTLIFWAIAFVLFAFFLRRGANWARIVLTILTVLALVNVIPGFPFGLLQVLASIAALILMWLRPSSEWIAAIRASKAPRV